MTCVISHVMTRPVRSRALAATADGSLRVIRIGSMVPVRPVMPVRGVVHGQIVGPFGWENDRSPNQPARCHSGPVMTGLVSHSAGYAPWPDGPAAAAPGALSG